MATRYVWNKYNRQSYTYYAETSMSLGDGYTVNSAFVSPIEVKAYSNKSFNSNTGKYTLSGEKSAYYSVTGYNHQGLGVVYGTFVPKNDNTAELKGNGTFYGYEERTGYKQGSLIGPVSAASSVKYPQNNYSGSYWYIFQGEDDLDPTVSIPDTVMGGDAIQITVTPSDGKVYGGNVSYLYEYNLDDGGWTTIATTTETTQSLLVPAGTNTVQVRVRAQDDLGFVSNDYAFSASVSVTNNFPPTAPASITASNVMGGQEATVTLEAATDSDGEIINYTYGRQVDGGSWTQFASENSLTVTDQIDDSWTTVAYRARAMDDKGAEGPYATSQTYTVVHNLPPTAPGSIQVTNVTTGQEATVTLTAATDPDGTVESYIYERSVDEAEFQPFAKVNSLAQTDHISGDWGTVAYRACAVDDDGAAGPYVTSETKTVTTGLVTIAGPAADLGERPGPFPFWFSCGVSDQTAVQGIAVRVTVDGKDFFTGTLDSGAAKGLYIDTRFRGAGQHTIAVTASKEDYQPAAASYTFTVPSVVLPYEGRAEMPQNSAGQPVWWYGLARFIFGPDGKDLITLMQEMQAASPKMVTGSYQGTGQAGSSNPNTLAAGFRPRVVLLSSGYSIDIMIVATESGSTGTVEAVNYTLSDTGVSWYASSAAAQGNESGKTYRYVIFG